MPYVMVDVESDGPIPGDYSMICFGAIIVEPELNRTFYGQLKPTSDRFIPDALAVSGFSREQCLAFDDPQLVMEQFRDWVKENCKSRCLFVSDNNGFDWQFINWYFHHFVGSNPFGFSSTNSPPTPSRWKCDWKLDIDSCLECSTCGLACHSSMPP